MSRCRHPRPAFTLVELLVVIGVIAIVVAILLPVLGKARRNANDVYCRSNLKQVALATRMYANDNRDHYPDGYTLGGAFVRMLPGMRPESDPYSIPEVFGMPALYYDGGYLRNLSVWKCPTARPEIQAWGNTYVWALLGGATLAGVSDPRPSNIAGWTSLKRGRPDNHDVYWVYDNFATLPWTTGVRRTTGSAGTFPAATQVYPHDYRSKQIAGRRQGSINVCFLDGHVGVVAYVLAPGATTPRQHLFREP